ncbi:MAG: dihydropteroate synthase [Burkholderiales bacterium]|nr:dihydropteroate synthase [Burkholderiales bacterium]
MFLYLLVSNSLQGLRAELRQIKLELSYASYYSWANKLYLLIQTSGQVPEVEQFIAPSMPNNFDNPEQILKSWAYSELVQDINWLNYEQKAQASHNGCSLFIGNVEVKRSFLALPELMLIINQTPDSFSDGGKYYQQIDKIIEELEPALAAGVSIIDVGAESTRPGAQALNPAEEIKRLEPLLVVLNQLKSCYSFKLSLDSFRAETLLHFLPYLDIVNDVSGKLNSDCLRQIKAAAKSYAFMHSLTIPANPQIVLGSDCDPCAEILQWAESKLEQLLQLGFTHKQLICDPGIGFNKTSAQAWYLLRNISRLQSLDVELLVGHSRKRFLDQVTLSEYGGRDSESAAVANFLATQSVDYIRMHDYREYFKLVKTNNQLERKYFRGISK